MKAINQIENTNLIKLVSLDETISNTNSNKEP